MRRGVLVYLFFIGHQASAQFSEGKWLFLQGYFEKSISYLDRALPNKAITRQEILYWKGRAHSNLAEQEAALASFSKAQETANPIENEWYWKCQFRICLSSLQSYNFKKTDSVLTNFEKERPKKYPSLYYQVKYYYYYQKADFEKALEASLNALQIAEAEQDSLSMVAYSMDLGNSYHLISNFQKDVLYFKKAADLEEKMGIKAYYTRYMNGLVTVYQARNQHEEAIAYADKAILFSIQHKCKIDLAYGYLARATSEIAINKLTKAHDDLRNAKIIFKQLKDIYLFDDCNMMEGMALLKEGKDKEAIGYLENYVKVSNNRGGILNQNLAALAGLKTAYSRLGDYKSAFRFANQERVLHDSLLNTEKLSAIELLSNKYETEKDRRQIAEQGLQLSEKDKKLRTILLSGGLLLLMAVLFLIVLVYNQFQAEKQTFGAFQSIKEQIDSVHQNLLENNFDEVETATLGKIRDSFKPSLTSTKVQELKGDISKIEADFIRIFGQIRSFNATVSHELRFPMIQMQHALGRLEENQGKHAEIDYLKKYLKSMNAMIEALLNLAAIEEVALKPRVVDTNRLLEDIIAEIKPPVNVIIRYQKLPNITVDVYLFRQALINLLQNAIKFSEDSRPPIIEISAKTEENSICLQIKDNGIGFPDGKLELLFRQFSRLENAKSKPGFGLGLLLVKNIIEMHKGSIRASGQEGKGATFEMTIPNVCIETSKLVSEEGRIMSHKSMAFES